MVLINDSLLGKMTNTICKVEKTAAQFGTVILLHCGTVFRAISGLKIVSLNLRVSRGPVMSRNVAVPHVGKLTSHRFILF
jgi:hypothetical protein